MYYSDEIIEEVIGRNDIVDIISGYVHLKKKGSNYFGLCPFHNEKSPSFSVSQPKQMYYCFGCGAGGSALTFLMQYENYSFKEALEALADRAGVKLPEEGRTVRERRQELLKSKILEINKLAANYFYYQLRREQGKGAYIYLCNRGLKEETMKGFGLGYANKYSDDLYRYLKQKGYDDETIRESGLMNVDEKHGMYDKFWNRVIFPIMDVNNKVIGFGGRVMGEGSPKYLNSPETKVFDKGRNLYGLNRARRSKRNHQILCEGYMDVIALHQAGFDQAVASLGTALTHGQASLMKRYTEEVLLTYDSDEAGTKAALRAIPILREGGIITKVIHMEPYKDPDEFIKHLGAEEFEKRIAKAENSFFFELRILEQGFQLKDPQEKTKFHNQVAKKIAQFEEEIERENYLQAAAEKYHIGFEQLRRLVNTYVAKEQWTKEAPKPKSGMTKKKEKPEGRSQSQKLLLTWMMEEPNIYPVIRGYIGPEDFTENLYKTVAQQLFDQLEQGDINPGAIMSHFEGEEEQREVASMFHTHLEELNSKTEREKALKDLLIKVKKYSLEQKTKDASEGLKGIEKIVEGKKALEALQNTHISFD
ncbi:MAG: DNA primase [Lachnospiraceae bacterium]|jgi:DNA primase|nr:DNA primase [Lachnospiraceae bacterium]